MKRECAPREKKIAFYRYGKHEILWMKNERIKVFYLFFCVAIFYLSRDIATIFRYTQTSILLFKLFAKEID